MSESALPSQTQVCVVGAGPAGVICSYILALKGIEVVLLEGESDFDRAFRGDTLHASSLEILEQLGHADAVLDLCNSKIGQLKMNTHDATITMADFSGLDSRYPFVAIIPQDRFLTYLVKQADDLPNFSIIMNARVHKLIEDDGKIEGVTFKHDGGEHELKADLTIGADGRGSSIRRLAELKLEKTSPPMDVLWFTQPIPDALKGNDVVDVKIGRGTMLVNVNRGDYLQLGYIIMKGSYKELREKGIAHFHAEVRELVPELGESLEAINDWSQLAILSVVTGRVSRWYREGLLVIGDAAHVMSPVGGVGINYAIQDAVAAVNLLAEPIKANSLTLASLKAVQDRREKAITFIQKVQSRVQQRIVSSALKSDAPFKPPLPLTIISRVPFLQRRFAKLLAYGLQPEKINAL